jgi:hypothetical protein
MNKKENKKIIKKGGTQTITSTSTLTNRKTPLILKLRGIYNNSKNKLNQTNQSNQTNQLNQINQLNQSNQSNKFNQSTRISHKYIFK